MIELPSIIPTRFRCSIALDTSALGNVLDDKDAMERFISAVRRKHATVFISDMVLFEISSDGDVDGVFFRLQRLQALCLNMGPLLHRSPDHKDLMRAETRSWLKGPISEGWSGFENASRRELLKIAKQLPESYLWLRKKKEYLHREDRSMFRLLAEKDESPDATAITEAIAAREPPRVDNSVVELAVNLSEGAVSAARIVAEQRRFKATHAVSHLLWRLFLANAADPKTTTREQEQVVGLWRTKAKKRGVGTWYDIFIAGATAYNAYNEFLVSDDNDQRRRCEYLRKMGLLSFQSISLQEFIR